jgi:uncharacterized protein
MGANRNLWPPLDFTVKSTSRCNLDCSYCYVYHKGDDSWRDRPATMPDHVFAAALDRIREYCLLSGQPSVEITYHGGEPCLIGVSRFSRWCRQARAALGDITQVRFGIQTNGTLVDDDWVAAFNTFDVVVGVSIDGPREVHDRERIDRQGRGSYEKVAAGIERLRNGGVDVGLLSVIQPGGDGLAVHRHLLGLGVNQISYLFPHFTHDTIDAIRRLYGPAPCAHYLLPILDFWWEQGTIDQQISIFWQMSRVILGGRSGFDLFGNRPLAFVFIEPDGSIEGLDTLRVSGPGMAATGLNVLTDGFSSIASVNELHRQAIFDGFPLPSGCHDCVEAATCAGGHLADRFSRARGFDNPSVWCDDLLLLFGHMRQLLDVTPQETALRRQALSELYAGSVRP